MNMNSGSGSVAAKIKASVSVNPAMDREFVGTGVQSSSVMDMNLAFGAHTYIKRNEKWISRNQSICVDSTLWIRQWRS